jgi:hypothetical protein
MDAKPVRKLEAIRDVMIEVEDACAELIAGIENDDEKRVAAAIKSFPTQKTVVKHVELLCDLMAKKPWEK